MTDYFDVGWYVDINIGSTDKPFKCTNEAEAYRKGYEQGSGKPLTLAELVKTLWTRACEEQGIPADSKFVVFDPSNKYAKLYNEAMLLVTK
jgi:hypothetical protein